MTAFEEIYGSPPDAAASAPGRVNLLGEHTDYNEGYVLPTAIPQRMHVALRRSANPYSSAYSSQFPDVARFTLEHAPPEGFSRYVYGCLREVAHIARNAPAVDVYVHSEVPMGVGLSSSAALEVALLRALRDLLELALDDVQLARMAQRAEVVYAGVNCGILDQMASSLLEPGSMLFLDTRSLRRRLRPLPHASEILVLDSGTARSLASTKYNERRAECEQAAHLLGVRALRDIRDEGVLQQLPTPLLKRARHVVTENARVLNAARPIGAKEFGALMSASHRSLRDDYEVSIPPLDRLVELLESQGDVYGAKLTGAGFGGACVALCRAGSALHVGESVLGAYNTGERRASILVPPADTLRP